MKRSRSSDTIAVNTSKAKVANTMKGADEVLTMKALHAKSHSARQIARLLACSHHTVQRYIENGFQATPREQQPESCMTTRIFSSSVSSDMRAILTWCGRNWRRSWGSMSPSRFHRARTVQRAVKPYRDRLRAARLATQRYETKPGKQLQIDFGVKIWSRSKAASRR